MGAYSASPRTWSPSPAISERRPCRDAPLAATGRPPATQGPPLPVTRSAWRALSRARSLAWSNPISRNDATVVSSQNTNEQDQVVGQDQSEHRDHEQQEEREEPSLVRVAAEVGHGVE